MSAARKTCGRLISAVIRRAMIVATSFMMNTHCCEVNVRKMPDFLPEATWQPRYQGSLSLVAASLLPHKFTDSPLAPALRIYILVSFCISASCDIIEHIVLYTRCLSESSTVLRYVYMHNSAIITADNNSGQCPIHGTAGCRQGEQPRYRIRHD